MRWTGKFRMMKMRSGREEKRKEKRREGGKQEGERLLLEARSGWFFLYFDSNM